MKILLLVPHLGGGGTEKVFALLAQRLSREKYELHLGLVTDGFKEADALFAGVTVHRLGARRVRLAVFSVLRLVWRLRPQVIVCGMFHLNFLVLLLRPFFPAQIRILVRQNGTVSSALAFGSYPRRTRCLYRWLYRRADSVICQSAAMARDLARELGMGPERICVLANPVDVEGVRRAMMNAPCAWSGAGPHLLAVGRLAYEKGFDLLLEALGRARRLLPGIDLVIAGEGPERAALTKQCYELGLDSAVRFAGSVDNPATFYVGATVFVLTSRHEGMPNALLEAAAGGLPIVALPTSEGVTELLRGKTGVWIGVEVSAEALEASLTEALATLAAGTRFDHSFLDDFALEFAIQRYEGLIDECLAVGDIAEAVV